MKSVIKKCGISAFIISCFLFSNILLAQTENGATFASRSDKNKYSRIIEEANQMYKRMQYVNAAKKFQDALNLSTTNDPNVVGKLGDCYYYNSEMKEAYKWYEKMYTDHKQDMSSAYLFKYMHALKGNYKYGKAKKIDEAYLSKINEERADKKANKNEAELRKLIQSKNKKIRLINIKTNTGLSEFGPMYYGDKLIYSANDKEGKKIYKWDGNPFLDLFIADMGDRNGHLSAPKKLSDNINTEYHEADVTFTKDLKTMYFTRNNHKKKERRGNDGINHLMLLKSTLKNGEWTKPKILPFVTDEYSFGHPALSDDDKKLYFVSNMPGSLGETDLFVVDINEDGSYSAPKNLGETVNTAKKEMFPYVIGDKMYFASDGLLGLGGLDLFVTTLTADGYSEPKNLARPFNSNMDDFALILKPADSTGYFSSNRVGGRGNDDIYFFRNKTKQELEEDDTPIAVIDSTTTPSYAVKPTVINKDSLEVINLNRILFPFDKATITTQAKGELAKVLDFMRTYPDAIIKIKSHTDSRGPASYNQSLSQRRAESTKRYLIQNGLSAARIESAIGFGEADLVNECADGVKCSREKHHQNRRSEFVVVKKYKE